jgi:hypothetical protein
MFNVNQISTHDQYTGGSAKTPGSHIRGGFSRGSLFLFATQSLHTVLQFAGHLLSSAELAAVVGHG